MKVSVTSGTQTYIVCDHGESEPMDDSRIATGFAVQEVQYFRAVERRLFLRQLHGFDQTIHVYRLHVNHAVAEAYMLDLERVSALQGLVTFEMKSPSGSISKRYLRNGVVMCVGVFNTGKSTDAFFRVMGGQIRTSQ
jgi:hypothetical protein